MRTIVPENPAARNSMPVRAKAFTRIEVVLGVVMGTILVSWLMAALVNARGRSRSICCNCNLKQIGLGFRMWSSDHRGQFPWRVDEWMAQSPTNDGARL